MLDRTLTFMTTFYSYEGQKEGRKEGREGRKEGDKRQRNLYLTHRNLEKVEKLKGTHS